jgi:iron-sulfur cluster assembly accessory protein
MDITLAPDAAKRISFIARAQGKPAILRMAVEAGGCSGFQYRFDLAGAFGDDDISVETDGARLVIDPMSLALVSGATVTFVDDLSGSGFKVVNPNMSAGCSCGSSFTI